MKRQAMALAVLTAVIGCDSPTRPDPRDGGGVTGLVVNGNGTFTELNQVNLLLATAQLENAQYRDVTAEAVWQSSDPRVVSVSPRGEAAAVGLGVARITATFSNHQAGLDVQVVLADAAVRLQGSYRFTITAAPICGNLPGWAKQREYGATIEQAVDGSAVLNVAMTRGQSQFEVRVRETSLSIDFPLNRSYWYYYYGTEAPVFSDQIDAQLTFTLQGTATATLHSVAMSGTFVGKIRTSGPNESGDCGIQEHQFTLARR